MLSTAFTLPRMGTKFSERAFSDTGDAAWNALHDDLLAVVDPAEFRKQL